MSTLNKTVSLKISAWVNLRQRPRKAKKLLPQMLTLLSSEADSLSLLDRLWPLRQVDVAEPDRSFQNPTNGQCHSKRLFEVLEPKRDQNRSVFQDYAFSLLMTRSKRTSSSFEGKRMTKSERAEVARDVLARVQPLLGSRIKAARMRFGWPNETACCDCKSEWHLIPKILADGEPLGALDAQTRVLLHGKKSRA